jgi:two-component system NarL family sensor kinase
MPSSRRDYWPTLIISLIAISFGVIFVGRHIANPSDGARLEPGENALTPNGLIVTPLRQGSSGLQAGDLVIAVEGRSIESWAQSLFDHKELPSTWKLGQTVSYTIVRGNRSLDLPVRLVKYPFWNAVRINWGTIAYAAIYLVVATFVIARRPDNRAGRILFFGAACLTSSTAWSFGLQVSDFMDGVGFWLYKISTLFFYNLYWTVNFHFSLCFPRPLKFTERHHRWLIPAIYVVPFMFLFVYLAFSRQFSSNILDWFSTWTDVEGLHASLFLILSLITIVIQYRLNSTGFRRQQIRWVAFAGLLAGGGGLLLYILPPLLGVEPVGPNIAGLIVLPFPISLAIAILRYNLFDTDTLINRTLVYGALTAGIAGIYILTVSLTGTLLNTKSNLFVSLLATGLVAILFQPLRERLQTIVNRRMYGERDDPIAVLSRLGEQLERTSTPEGTLSGIVETVAETLKLPYVAIELRAGDEPAASYGIPTNETLQLPLVYQKEQVGQLVVGQRDREDDFSTKDRQLLENIARQAGAAAFNARLTADLTRARQRLVTTREEERRRIRRDLHDGLGPQLASQTLTLDAIARLIQSDPEKAIHLLEDLKSYSQEAIVGIRQLIYDLRPPVLDDLGLITALKEDFTRMELDGLQIRLDAPERLPDMPAAVELAVYRITQEAVYNVVKHAGAKHCQVRMLSQSRALLLEINDDGRGVPSEARPGVGLHSMRERAEELGGRLEIGLSPSGGTQVTAWLPIETNQVG